MTDTILSQTCVILFLMAVGLLAGRLGCLNEGAQKALSDFLMSFCLPAAIFLSAEGPLTPERRTGTLWMLALSFGYFAVVFPLALAAGRRISGPDSRKRLFSACLLFGNVGLLGFPVADALFPDSGLFYAAFFNLAFNLVFFTLGMRLFRPDGRMGSLRQLAKNPNLLATLAMVVCLVLDWHLPEKLHYPVSLLGGLCSPLSLILVGARLASVRPRELLAGKAIKAAALIRLVLEPLAAIAVLALLRPPLEVAMVLVVMCAMPAAANTVIASQQAGTPADFAAKTVAVTSSLFPLTLPLVLLTAQYILA